MHSQPLSIYLSLSCSHLQGEDAAQAESDHHHGQQHGGHIPHVARRLHQGNAPHLPVVAQHDGGQQQPGVEGQQVGIGQNPGGGRERRMWRKRKDGRGAVKDGTEEGRKSNHNFILFLSTLKCLSLYQRINEQG